MAENAYLTNHWVFSLHYFCNDVHLAKEHQCTKKYLIWCSGWSDVEKWQSKVGSTPWKTEHVRRNGQGSSSGANKNSEQCSPLGAKFRACPFRRTCSIHILKRPFFLAQSAPSDNLQWFDLTVNMLHQPSLYPLEHASNLVADLLDHKYSLYLYTNCVLV